MECNKYEIVLVKKKPPENIQFIYDDKWSHEGRMILCILIAQIMAIKFNNPK